MLMTLFRFEWKLILRSKSRLLAWLIFCLIGFYSFEQGNALYRFHAISADSAMVKQERGMSSIRRTLDTIRITSTERHSLEDPFYLDWQSQPVALKPQDPLSVLSIGQSDIYLSVRSARFTVPVFNNNFAEFKNPEQLLAGTIDAAFFLVFLIPLFFIAITYNLYSADRESGVFTLLRIQADKTERVMFLRLLIRWYFALTPAILLMLFSGLMLSGKKEFSLIHFAQWWAVAFLYLAGWLAIAGFILRLRFSSLVSAITLSGTWVVLLIVIPGLLNTWLDYRYPLTSKTEVTSFRDEDTKLWYVPLDEYKAHIYKAYPQWQADSLRIDSNQLRSFGYFWLLAQKEKELYARLTDSGAARAKAESRSFWINPAGAVLRCFSLISGTSLAHQQLFDRSVIDYRENRIKYLYSSSLSKPHFTAADFAAAPLFKPDFSTARKSLPLLPLLLMLFLPGLLTLFRKRES